MSHPLVLRLLETFFRRWVLYLVPMVIFLGLGLMSVTGTKDTYVSTGVVYVDDESLLASITGVGSPSGQGYQTPAEVISEQMSSAFQTDGLVRSLAEQAGMTAALEDGTATIGGLRGALSFAPSGANLIHVGASTQNPEESSRLATAAVASFIDFVVEANLSESAAAEEFLTELVQRYQGEEAAASKSLDTYLLSHPDPPTGARPTVEQAAIDSLRSAVATANGRYTEALDKLENARLATAQTRGDVSQRLQVVDEPQTPSAPVGSMRTSVMTMAMFGSLGFLLSAAAVLAGTLLDRSIRTAADVRGAPPRRGPGLAPEGRPHAVLRAGARLGPAPGGGTPVTTLDDVSVPEDDPRRAPTHAPLLARGDEIDEGDGSLVIQGVRGPLHYAAPEITVELRRMVTRLEAQERDGFPRAARGDVRALRRRGDLRHPITGGGAGERPRSPDLPRGPQLVERRRGAVIGGRPVWHGRPRRRRPRCR